MKERWRGRKISLPVSPSREGVIPYFQTFPFWVSCGDVQKKPFFQFTLLEGLRAFYVFPTERDKRGAGLIHLSVNKLHAWSLNESLVTGHVGKARKAQNRSINTNWKV